MGPQRKKVFVSGCFDLLHCGHVAFLEEAATYGDLYVGIGSDDTIFHLKGHYPIYNQDERRYLLHALKPVTECRVNKGSGIMDFIVDLEEVQPDILFVNEDGHTVEKEALCKEKGITYIVSERVPPHDCPERSTTDLREVCQLPYRIDIAGGWLDQPFVSKYYPGPVIVCSIEPTIKFNNRSGMATSTREKAKELWHTSLPPGDPEHLAKILFSYDNPPGKNPVSGSQDALGIVMPGLNKLHYEGNYWPSDIISIHDEDILSFVEEHFYFLLLAPRKSQFNPLQNTNITMEGARALSIAAEQCWEAILKEDLELFGQYFREAFEAQVHMFPNMVDAEIMKAINQYANHAHGWKLSGAGGGGYIIFISSQEIPGTTRIKIRRKNYL